MDIARLCLMKLISTAICLLFRKYFYICHTLIPTTMLLFTWAGFNMKLGHLFKVSFDLLEKTYHAVNPNILLIIVGFIGVAGWLTKQYQLNSQAEQEGTLK